MMKKKLVKIAAPLHQDIKVEAARLHQTMEVFIETALTNHLSHIRRGRP